MTLCPINISDEIWFQFDSNEDEKLLAYAENYQTSLVAKFPKRTVTTAVMDINGKSVFVTRYFRPIKPPPSLMTDANPAKVTVSTKHDNIDYSYSLHTQQNSYSISHLPGTVATTVMMYSLFSNLQHRDYWRDYWTLTTLETHVIRYPLPWGLYRNLSTRHLVGNCTITTWEDTRYPLHTVTV